jgi:xanthine/uracil permease
MAKSDKKAEVTAPLPFGRKNYILMGAAVLAIIIGYISLGSGSITLAPILLVLGYCVLFPLGIIWKDRADEAEETVE